ncbi:MAG: virulence RhuM family protein [Chitinispirillales bacterium]|jgi:hypothetical protein|nr:virulence RhuM family protein [Chitinispirillales bacterium]
MKKEETRFLIYTTPKENVKVDVIVKDETIWLTQAQIAQLFDVEIPAISKHLKNILDEGELEEKAVISKMETTASDGKNYLVKYYNLDAIISVGYRVNSSKATQFRIWATKTLKEFVVKGFVLDDERLKQGETAFGKDYFRELLERVRSIRVSERRIWQKITDIFAECSVDYNKNSQITHDFYVMVQNKFHYAITGHTAAEIIHSKANRNEKNMGLQTWKNAPDGRILNLDVKIAKNYLFENDIKRLERTISGYFDYVEDLIEQRKTFTMEEFAESIDKFLLFREYKILSGKGKISKVQAEQKANEEYDEFNKTQKIISDFDKRVKKLKRDN